METIFLNLTSNITGGLVDDMTSVIVALVFISLVLMGADWIKDIFSEQLNSWSDSRADERLGADTGLSSLKRKAKRYRGTAEGDVYQYQYKKKFKSYITDYD